MSAPQRSAHCSFSTSSSVPLETGEAPMLALILVIDARPMHIGSSLYLRCTLLAGMIIRPAATSSRICSGVKMRLALGHPLHLRRDDAQPGKLELRLRR